MSRGRNPRQVYLPLRQASGKLERAKVASIRTALARSTLPGGGARRDEAPRSCWLRRYGGRMPPSRVQAPRPCAGPGSGGRRLPAFPGQRRKSADSAVVRAGPGESRSVRRPQQRLTPLLRSDPLRPVLLAVRASAHRWRGCHIPAGSSPMGKAHEFPKHHGGTETVSSNAASSPSFSAREPPLARRTGSIAEKEGRGG